MGCFSVPHSVRDECFLRVSVYQVTSQLSFSPRRCSASCGPKESKSGSLRFSRDEPPGAQTNKRAWRPWFSTMRRQTLLTVAVQTAQNMSWRCDNTVVRLVHGFGRCVWRMGDCEGASARGNIQARVNVEIPGWTR